ncbi:MAG: YraN family protein, partial [Chloroflexi bacterium]|nr:YraN family protein [Chloroflexota bacterium]
MPSPRSRLGAQGERIAEAHLVALGLVVEARNSRTRFGETDLIARNGEETVFVEVRTKRS